MARSASLLTLLVLLGSLGCFAHAPERFAGPDSVIVTGDLPGFPVTVIEDEWGIPHIRARSLEDAVFALGVLHAEERLWQMELNRRVGAGTLSEIFGKRTLETDRFLRTVGFGRASRAALASLDDDLVALLQAYSDGVNAAVANMEELPPEFGLLRIEPEPWTPLDSVGFTKSMAWMLTGSASKDALWDQLARDLGPEQASWYVPDYPEAGPRIMPPDQMMELRAREDEDEDEVEVESEGGGEQGARGRSGGSAAGVAMLDALLGVGEPVGSNNWVIGGDHTDTGLPLLSNDPHLGVGVPSIWYLAEIDCPQMHVIGATFPGLPGMPIGHNETIAWGVTNSGADVLDLYREQVDPDDPTRARREDGWEAMQVVTEQIVVKGRRKPVELEVRIGSNGPLVTEFFTGFEEEVAMRWTALEETDTTVAAMVSVMRARDWTQFREALRQYVVPSQNFVYADTSGHVAWKVPGLIPIRKGWDGRRAGRGWVADEAWQGWIPYDELPEALDPLRGWIASANNHPVPGDYPHLLGTRFSPPQRAMRIVDLIEQGEARTVAGNHRMQMDVLSPQALELTPRLLALPGRTPLEAAALELLRDWDGNHEIDSAAAAIYNAWLIEVVHLLVKEREGGKLWGRIYALHPGFLSAVFDGDAGSLCVGPAAPGRPATDNCQELAALAWSRAVRKLKARLGPDPTAWRWGELHQLEYHHQLAFTPSLRKKLDTRLESPGGTLTVNVGAFPERAPFTQTWFASYRQVIDLSDWNNSVWMHSPGQSGVPHRDHYRDLAEPYVGGAMLPMLFGEGGAEEHAARTRQIRR